MEEEKKSVTTTSGRVVGGKRKAIESPTAVDQVCPYSPFPPGRTRPGPGPHKGQGLDVGERPLQSPRLNHCRGTSLIRRRTHIGPYRRPLPRVLGGS